MVRPASSIGKKWNDAYVSAADDAIEAYGNALPGLATKIIAGKGAAKAAYTAALDSASYDANVRAGLAPGVADVNNAQRLAQIEQTGFTQAQQSKLVTETEIRRHLSTLVSSVRALADGGSGNLKLPAVSNNLKNQIINVAMMKFIRNFSTTSTAEQVVAVIKANIGSADNITIG